ncbi:MAG: hypothetical protein CUN53_18620, partial [Phototrophicales bacterium]
LNRYFLILYLLLGIFVVVLFLTIGSPLLLCVVIPLTLYQFYLIFGIVGVVGKAYNFGTAMGCVTVLLTAIVLALIGAGLGILLGSAAQQAFQSLLT